ncbi:rho guanine nucleotide exchange factor 37 [Pelodytes ibericus]
MAGALIVAVAGPWRVAKADPLRVAKADNLRVAMAGPLGGAMAGPLGGAMAGPLGGAVWSSVNLDHPQSGWRKDAVFYPHSPRTVDQSYETIDQEESFSSFDEEDDDCIYGANNPRCLSNSEHQTQEESSFPRSPDSMDNSFNKRNDPVSHGNWDDLGYPPAHTDSNLDNTQDEPIYEHINDLRCSSASGLHIAVHPAILELISTEETYVQSLHAIISDIQETLKKLPEVDVKSLFSNIDDILQVATSFLNELKETEKDEEIQLFRIGTLFQEFQLDMENVYSLYCWGYQRALTLLENYQETHVFEKIQQALLSIPSSSYNYPDVTFYLVIPVQRITKYPLLLEKLLAIKPISKEAHDELQIALHTMQHVNSNINENKRRREVANKYVRPDQRTLREKVSQLNTHTLTKKTQRLSQMFKHQAGIVPKRENKEFDDLAAVFQSLTSTVSHLLQNVTCHMKNLEEFLKVQPPMSFLKEPPAFAKDNTGFSNELYQSIYSDCKRRLQFLVLQPLTNLSECLKGPKNLIRKRMDKLLDYENLEEKYVETGKMALEEEEIMNTYKAIHDLLMSELPHCILLSKQLLTNVLLTFIRLQLDVSKQALHAAEKEASMMEHNTLSKEHFKTWAEDSLRLSLSQLADLKRIFDVEMPAAPVQDQNPAQERQVKVLLKRYEPGKIYQVMQNISSSKDMELTVQRGDYVAVLQYSDTKGNKKRWLVDTGGARGYVPSSKLQPFQILNNRKSSIDSLSLPNAKVENRRHSYTVQDSVHSSYKDPPPSRPVFQDIALYTFSARSDYEASIKQGEPVTIVEPHDKKGSTEWSLVEVGGRRGYVPSSYLGKIPVSSISISAASSYR